MTRKTHEAAGIAVTGIVLTTVATNCREAGALAIGVATVTGMYAALLPDFDTPRSYISRKFPLIYLPIWLLHALIRLVGLIPWKGQRQVRDFAKRLGHRGFAHYPLTWLIFFGLLTPAVLLTYGNIWTRAVLCGMVCGVGSHILGDAFFGGIELFYPFVKKRIRLSPLRTGGIAETVVFALLLLLDIRIYTAILM